MQTVMSVQFTTDLFRGAGGLVAWRKTWLAGGIGQTTVRSKRTGSGMAFITRSTPITLVNSSQAIGNAACVTVVQFNRDCAGGCARE